MSTLSSSSTLTQIQAAYDNASYAEDGSVTKAKAFITAVRLLIRRTAGDVAQGSERITQQENLRQFRAELEAAQGWLTANDTTTAQSVRHASFENFR